MYKNPDTRLEFISLYFDTTKNSHNNMDMKIIVKVYSFLFIENSIIITKKFHVLLKKNQNIKIKFMIFQKRVCNFLPQSTYNYF